jgi:hypothetical protein
MNLADWAQITSAAATVVAAGLAAFTTRLNLKQLRYQFRSHLLVANEEFQFRMCKTSLVDFFWTPPTQEARYMNGGNTEYSFHLLNTGAGSAQNVRIFAEFDYESVYNDLCEKLREHATDIEILQEGWGAKVMIGDKHLGGFKNPDQAYGRIEYIRPCRDDRVDLPFIIDPTLSFLSVGYGFYLMREQILKGLGHQEQIIDVNFFIEYTDAGGVKREQRDPHRLVVSGGRWKDDMSDGVCFVSLHKR